MNTGAFGENFPYTNFHNLNTDWIVKIAKDFLDQYTNIQNTIDEGLEELNSEYEHLNELLQEWYDTHSEDIANQLADAISDLNAWYNTHKNYLDNILEENTETFQSSAEAIAEEVIATIPQDYSEMGTTVNEMSSMGFTKLTVTTASYLIPNSAVTLGDHIFFMPINSTNRSIERIVLNGRYTEGGVQKYDCLAFYDPYNEIAHVVARRAYTQLQVVVNPWQNPIPGTYDVMYSIVDPADINKIETIVRRNYIKSGILERYYVGQGTFIMDRVIPAGTSIMFKPIIGKSANITGATLLGRKTDYDSNTSTPTTLVTCNNGELTKYVTTEAYDALQVSIVPFIQDQGDSEFSFLLGVMDNDFQNDLFSAYKNNYPVPPIGNKIDELATLSLSNAPHAMKEYVISANMIVGTMGTVKIETGTENASTYNLTVDSQNITITRPNSETTVAHGLTIRDNLNISIHCKKFGEADIIIGTATGTFKLENTSWKGCLFFRKYSENAELTSYLKLKAVSGSYSDAQFNFYPMNYEHDIWMCGDSYLDLIAPLFAQYGYDNIGFDGFSGRASYEALQSVKMALHFHIPKKIVWAIGMNNSDSYENAEINEVWYNTFNELKTLCKRHNIQLIPATIPTTNKIVEGVRTRYHEYKNSVIRNSGLRYIDIANVLGATSARSFVWYSGLQASDETHPSELGQQVIANTYFTELPECAN